MIESIHFRNFRVLEEASLPLGAFNVLVGPNGSGKSTALRALLACGEVASALVGRQHPAIYHDLRGAQAEFRLGGMAAGREAILVIDSEGRASLHSDQSSDAVMGWLGRIRGYVLDPLAVVRPVAPGTVPVLARDGSGLAAVLAQLNHAEPKRWAALVSEFCRLMPEFRDVGCERMDDGRLAFSVETSEGQRLQPETLSQGTVVLLAILSVVFAPDRPSLVCIEEVERGFHPRLLREVRDLLYRLSFPEDSGDTAEPVQVVATTHSPYVLDLFVDTPEDVVLATKEAGRATFQRLSDVGEVETLLAEGRLGDLWYSGILGGSP